MRHEGVEGRRSSFEHAVEEGTREALHLIHERFEEAANPRDKLDFHNTHHTEGVIRRTKKILEAIRAVEPKSVTPRMIQLAGLIASGHDTVQAYDVDLIEDEGHTKLVRKRHVGENEQASAQELIARVTEIGTKTRAGSALTKKDEEILREAIDVTVPDFSPELQTITQPHLSEQSSLIARAVALADLGGAGMDGPDVFLREGDALFREEQIDITEALRTPGNLSEDDRDYFKKRMLAWSESQSTFAEGRKTLFEQEIAGLSEKVQNTVRVLFSHFDESVTRSLLKTKEREGMSFEALARDMGYAL